MTTSVVEVWKKPGPSRFVINNNLANYNPENNFGCFEKDLDNYVNLQAKSGMLDG